MIGSRWARLRDQASVPLRRGAWYRVMRRTDSEAVLDVRHRSVVVPLGVLQFTDRPPSHWAVVPTQPAALGTPWTWGQRYAVCPRCCARAPLGRDPVPMRCLACDGEFDVAWGDSFFA
jgi:hypothetical protein